MKNVKASKKSDFRAVRPNTLRARYLQLMDGTHTLVEIATAMNTSKNNARVTIHCFKRDCGIGHQVAADGKITAVFPKNVALSDAIVTIPVAPLAVNPEPKLTVEQPANSDEQQLAA